MKIKELICEAGLIGKLGTAVGKAAGKAGTAVGAAQGLGQQFAQGAAKWQGTGFGLKPRQTVNTVTKKQLPGNVGSNEMRDLLDAVLKGQQLNPAQLKLLQKIRDGI